MAIEVEVAYALPSQQLILALTVEEGATLAEVIRLSGILERFPEIDLEKQSVGIFGLPKALTDKVEAGDRVEIYRDLLLDPKEARRLKAKARKT